MLERDLYGHVQNYLDIVFSDQLQPIYGSLKHLTAITSNTGGTKTGIWSKPDLCLVSLIRQKYGLQWQLDLHGFEVKPANSCSAQSVHEALNHTSLVHFSHLVWHCPQWEDRDPGHHAILDRCSHYGVGLVTFPDPGDARTYALRVPARRHSPKPDLVDEFIETRLPDGDKQTILKWVEAIR